MGYLQDIHRNGVSMVYWQCDPPYHPVSTTDAASRVLRRFQGILEVAVHQIRLRGPHGHATMAAPWSPKVRDS